MNRQRWFWRLYYRHIGWRLIREPLTEPDCGESCTRHSTCRRAYAGAFTGFVYCGGCAPAGSALIRDRRPGGERCEVCGLTCEGGEVRER